VERKVRPVREPQNTRKNIAANFQSFLFVSYLPGWCWERETQKHQQAQTKYFKKSAFYISGPGKG
jgi:ribonuclease I